MIPSLGKNLKIKLFGSAGKLLIGALLGVFLATSCNNTNETKLTFMPDMAKGTKPRPHREYLDPPEGSVAYGAILYPKTHALSAELLSNPLSQKGDITAHEAVGKFLFETHCAVCHGVDGKGDGKINDLFPKPADLTASPYRERKDGDIFHTITFGSPSEIMPGYGYAITPMERWQIILHVHELQKAGGGS